MAEAKFGDTVKAHFTVKLNDGTVFDSTFDHEPIEFTIGIGQVIAGFEKAIIGMSTGASKTINVQADDAFGSYNKELITEVDRNMFPADFKLELGQHIQIPQVDAEPFVAKVVDISESKVILDKNHPLAGKDLIIDIQLLEIV